MTMAVAAFFRSIRKLENFDELSLVGLICVTATMPLANINMFNYLLAKYLSQKNFLKVAHCNVSSFLSGPIKM